MNPCLLLVINRWHHRFRENKQWNVSVFLPSTVNVRIARGFFLWLFQTGQLPNWGHFNINCGSTANPRSSEQQLCDYSVASPGWPPACMSAGHRCAQGSERERGCYVFIKSTRKQLRRCSLDTPHLFINIPLAVTLLFIIACWFICSSFLKPHLTSSFTLTESDVVRMYKDVAL